MYLWAAIDDFFQTFFPALVEPGLVWGRGSRADRGAFDDRCVSGAECEHEYA